MAKRRIQFSVRFLLIATGIVALSVFWFVTRRAKVDFSIASVQTQTFDLEPFSKNLVFRQATFSVTNSSPYTIWYWGNANQDRPDHWNLQKYHESWSQSGRSTNTSRWVALHAGESVSVPTILNDECEAIKIGVRLKGALFGPSVDQWSDETPVIPSDQDSETLERY